MSTPPSPLSSFSICSTTLSRLRPPSYSSNMTPSKLPSMSESETTLVKRTLRSSSNLNSTPRPPMELRSSRSWKKKMGSFDLSSPPAPYSYVRTQADKEEVTDPLAHHRPPFEHLWDADAVPVPVVPLPEGPPSLEEGGVLYFAYGKDMDPDYLEKFFKSTEVTAAWEFVAVGKLVKYHWFIDGSSRFPKILPNGEKEVWGLIYRLSQPCLESLAAKAKKRGQKMDQHKVETFEKTGAMGFWNAPLLSLGKATVHIMVGTLDDGDEGMEIYGAENRTLKDSKKRKVLAGLLWGASEGLPAEWTAEIRAKVGGINDARDTGYWTMNTHKPKLLMGMATDSKKRALAESGWKLWSELSKFPERRRQILDMYEPPKI